MWQDFFLESSPSAKCSGCQKLQILNSRRNLKEREDERAQRKEGNYTVIAVAGILRGVAKLGKNPKLMSWEY